MYRILGGPQARSGGAENFVPTGTQSRTVQAVAHSLYRLSYRAHTTIYKTIDWNKEDKKYCRNSLLNLVHVFLCFSTHKQMTAVPDQVCREPSSLRSLASIVPYKERRSTDEESTNKVLAANRELDEYSEKLMGKRNFANVEVIYAANK